MARRKQNKWRKWQASAVATLTVAALFQYVRSSDAFDVAYAAVNDTDSGTTTATQIDTRDDVMDEWITDNTDQYSWDTDGYSQDQDQDQADSSRTTVPEQSTNRGGSESRSQQLGQNDRNSSSGSSSGNYRSRTGAS